MDEQRRQELRNELLDSLKEVFSDFLTAHESEFTSAEAILMVFSVLSYQIGYIDRLAEITGVPVEDRTEIGTHFANQGNTRADEVVALKKQQDLTPNATMRGNEWKN